MDDAGSDWIHEFVFARELSEVYLLLDHISGRTGSNLTPSVATDGAEDLLEGVCAIGWPPTGSTIGKAKQAATLLRARDWLNDRAAPATGASIAFTLLVTGDAPSGDTPRPLPRLPGRGPLLPAPPLAVGVPQDGAQVEIQGAGQLRSSVPAPPSRLSLAAIAFPNLAEPARLFRKRSKYVIAALVIWLLLTCALSWDIAGGTAILSRIDTLKSAKATLLSKTNAASGAIASGSVSVPPGSTDTAYCEVHRIDTVDNMRLCQALDENRIDQRIAYTNLADWLATWHGLQWLPRAVVCHGDCLARAPSEAPLTPNATDEQFSSILTAVLANSVLPVFYGILGAGAAIVRNLWSRMRDSLLSPRDLTLALGQLALGAVIGACIGLFVAPGGTSASNGSVSLVSSVALSASALSFVAGFGVENVFLALETLIRRVFNTK